jgi:hypothetical protein
VNAIRLSLLLPISIALTTAIASAQTTNPGSRVLIRSAKPYTSLAARISSLGGRVLYEYKYVDAVKAELPEGATALLRDIVNASAITKDEEILLDGNVDPLRLRYPGSSSAALEVTADSVEPLDGSSIESMAAVMPDAYR